MPPIVHSRADGDGAVLPMFASRFAYFIADIDSYHIIILRHDIIIFHISFIARHLPHAIIFAPAFAATTLNLLLFQLFY